MCREESKKEKEGMWSQAYFSCHSPTLHTGNLARYTIYMQGSVRFPEVSNPSSSAPGKKGIERGKSKCFMLIPLSRYTTYPV